jgi:hypothetical protein
MYPLKDSIIFYKEDTILKIEHTQIDKTVYEYLNDKTELKLIFNYRQWGYKKSYDFRIDSDEWDNLIDYLMVKDID